MTQTVLDRRRVLAWCLFDFANSSYSAVISVAVFSVYFTQKIVGNATGLGDLWWGRVVSASMIAVVLTAPVLGASADRAGARKRMLFGFTWLCIACVALFPLIRSGAIAWWSLAFALPVLANFAFESALVYYNAYLPDLAPPERRGWVSGLGFGIGYLGSIAGLAIALPLVGAGRFDLIWLSVAAFFALFSLPAFLTLPADRATGVPPAAAVVDAVRHLGRLARDVWARPALLRFLLAYFLYLDGVETTIYFSGIYAAKTLGFATKEVLLLFLAVQFSAFAGALLLAKPTDRWGAKRVVSLSLMVWVAVAAAAALAQSKPAFFVVAMIAGTQLGTVQAASRALMASLIPTGKEAELFGFYAMVGKSSAVLGPLVFGTVSFALGGNQRAAVLAVGAFFVAGLVLLQRVRPASPPG
ncbi:MAG TPA: MFS transporter [Gemmatimonadales bacterium]